VSTWGTDSEVIGEQKKTSVLGGGKKQVCVNKQKKSKLKTHNLGQKIERTRKKLLLEEKNVENRQKIRRGVGCKVFLVMNG